MMVGARARITAPELCASSVGAAAGRDCTTTTVVLGRACTGGTMSVVAGAILVVVLDAVVGLTGDVLVVGADDVVDCSVITLEPAAIDDDMALDEPRELMECNSVRCESSRDGYTHCS